MQTGPTPIIPGCAGTPLSHQATESRRNSTHRPNPTGAKSDDSISDTLETTDREPEGQQPITRQESEGQNDRTDQGSLLDLSG